MNLKQYIQSITHDAVLWLSMKHWRTATSPIAEQGAIKAIVELLIAIPNEINRDNYVKKVCSRIVAYNEDIKKQVAQLQKQYKKLENKKGAPIEGTLNELSELERNIESLEESMLPLLNARDLAKYVKTELEEQKKKPEAERFNNHGDDDESLPKWVNANQLYTEGFVMNNDKDADKVGIYYKGEHKPVERLTNYVVNPLFFVQDPLNSRRLVEVYNGRKNVVIELPSRAFIAQDVFETEIVSRGAFYSEPGFSKPSFKRLVNWLSDNMLNVHPLNTLGWQPEGFFAFSNCALDCTTDDMATSKYNEYGIVNISDKAYLSEGASKLNEDTRSEDNIYENDMYLKFVESKLDFKNWASLFHKVYEEDAMFGIAFIFIAAFKDIVTKIAKCPHLYCYGPKGSGKSEFAESLMYFFFSGKNSDGKLIQGYNLNAGQGTPFSFFSRQERFRNVLMLFNEYDPNSIEFWKKGAFKSSYDGEGREVGSGETGKKRKTKIQKTNCVCMIAGQYLDTTDDGAVLSRSIPFKFSLERNKSRSDEAKDNFRELKEIEHNGLSSILSEVYASRNYVAKHLKDAYWIMSKELNDAMKKEGKQIEARLMSNYSLITAITQIMSTQLKLPFKIETMKQTVKRRMIAQAELLRDNNALNSFWRVVESLYDDGQLSDSLHFKLKTQKNVQIQLGSNRTNMDLQGKVRIMYIRFNTIYERFAKRYQEVYRKAAPDQDTLIVYLQDQSYYVGLNPGSFFQDKRTSSYMIYYDVMKEEMNVSFEKEIGDDDSLFLNKHTNEEFKHF